MTILIRFAEAVEKIARLLAVMACAAVCLIMAAQVYFRYVLNDSLLWSEELAVWMMVWMVFLAAPALSLRNEHVTVTAGIQILPKRAQAVLVILAKVLALVFLVFLAYYGWVVFGQSFHRLSPTMRISSRWAKLAMTVGSALMTLMTLASIARDITALRKADQDHFDRQVSPPEPVGDV